MKHTYLPIATLPSSPAPYRTPPEVTPRRNRLRGCYEETAAVELAFTEENWRLYCSRGRLSEKEMSMLYIESPAGRVCLPVCI